MTIPLRFASLYDRQEVIVWSDCLLDLGTDFLAGNRTGHANHDLSLRRREMHRPCFPLESAGICSHHVPMTTEWLYPQGAEFHRSLKEAREILKLSQDMKPKRSNANSGNSGPILGHGNHTAPAANPGRRECQNTASRRLPTPPRHR